MVSGSGQSISRDAQREWMQSLRARIAHIELVFNNGDDGHPLVAQLAHLESTRTVGVKPGNGYARQRLTAVKRRFAYDREIIQALDGLGGFFPDVASTEPWTELGDVDVVFLDKHGEVLGATVTHEGMVITPDDDERLDRQA
ncbi:hypothetical protein [Cryobacterium sp. Hb1]|jgi:hypothetical protein|uniref:hypothetical protein n=1 Tax=Cryobacterium sp. Hb1 TaxID=1259147 RepID=UPI001069F751|nr:hypothetical protein [Cryobacterium sp. Hb1]TFD66959.1 hypothetical protein E3T38_11225 [Cryobacterium sp. Hb1]